MTVDELLEAAEKVREERETDRVTALMLVFLEVLDRMPLAAEIVPFRTTAGRYWRDGTATKEEIEQAHLRTWQFIDAATQRSESSSDAAVLARATVCVLMPTIPDNSWFDTVEWFSYRPPDLKRSEP